ncbi:MAG: discoidin domain-containing protein [Colwellia sp.]
MLDQLKTDVLAVINDPLYSTYVKLEAIALFEESLALLEPKVGFIRTNVFATILASHNRWGSSAGPEVAGLTAFDGDPNTFVDSQSGSNNWVQADFGVDNYVQLTQVSLQPRDGQAFRLNGAQIMGSNDGETWVFLTEVPADNYTDNGDRSKVTLNIADNSSYRYIRFAALDGNYSNVSEIELYGSGEFGFNDRNLAYLQLQISSLNQYDWNETSWNALMAVLSDSQSAVNEASVTSAEMALNLAFNNLVPASNNLTYATMPARWFVGEPLMFSIHPDGSPDTGVDISATLPAGATFDANTGLVIWTPTEEQVGANGINFNIIMDDRYVKLAPSLSMSIYETPLAVVDELLAAIGDVSQYSGYSQVMLSKAETDVKAALNNNDFSVQRKLTYIALFENSLARLGALPTIDVINEATILASGGQWGNDAIDVTLSGLPVFDNNVGTFSDLIGSPSWISADFGEGREVTLKQVMLTPRTDFADRLNGAVILGSNDGETWTELVALGSPYSANNQNETTTLNVDNAMAYRYIRFDGGNAAEVVYLGDTNFNYNKKTLPYLIEKASMLNAGDWNDNLWDDMVTTLELAKAVIVDTSADKVSYDMATAELNTALMSLEQKVSSLDFSILNTEVSEYEGNLTFWISRSGGSIGQVTVDYSAVSDSAISGENFVATSGMLNWKDGELGTKSFTVMLIDNATVEGQKSFTVELSNLTGTAEIESISSIEITIDDAEDSVNESNSGGSSSVPFIGLLLLALYRRKLTLK